MKHTLDSLHLHFHRVPPHKDDGCPCMTQHPPYLAQQHIDLDDGVKIDFLDF